MCNVGHMGRSSSGVEENFRAVLIEWGPSSILVALLSYRICSSMERKIRRA